MSFGRAQARPFVSSGARRRPDVPGTPALKPVPNNRGRRSAAAIALLSLTVSVCPASANQPPAPPANAVPADGDTGVAALAMLCVDVSDPDGDPLDVTFLGRPGTAWPFTIVALPDTQFYAQVFPEIFDDQTDWIVENRGSRNIVFTTQLGDCVNNAFDDAQWLNASTALGNLEDPLTTGLADGLPYGFAPGNHDQQNARTRGQDGDEGATTVKYNEYFGLQRFQGRGYYGGRFDFHEPGRYPYNNDNNYQLFSAGGMDFIVIHLEMDIMPIPERDVVLDWADHLLMAHGNRRAVIVSHFLLWPEGVFSNQGLVTHDRFKDNPNVFLMLCGHVTEAGRRTDTFQTGTIHTVLSNYQYRNDGGDGWLRIMTFSPAQDEILVETYSPWLDSFETAEPHTFTLAYEMDDGPRFVAVADTVRSVPSGGRACAPWPGRRPDARYEWFVRVQDQATATTGPRWVFTSDGSCTDDAECRDDDPCTIDSCGAGTCANGPLDRDGDGICDDLDNCPVVFNPAQADSDGDDAGTLCDVCPGIADPGQVDTDRDLSGDACDCQGIDPYDGRPAAVRSVSGRRSGAGTIVLSWAQTIGADAYSLSRGRLSGLTGGAFGACLAEGVAGTAFQDPDVPPVGDGYFYLVQGENFDCGLGPLGYDSAETARSNADPSSCRGQGHTDARAVAEVTVHGTVSGGLASTWASDDTMETITEELVGAASRLEQWWEFEVTSGSRVELHLECRRSPITDGDRFTLDYSTDDGASWVGIPLAECPGTDTGIERIAELPATLSGTVWVRVVDSNPTYGAYLDSIGIDELFIRTIP